MTMTARSYLNKIGDLEKKSKGIMRENLIVLRMLFFYLHKIAGGLIEDKEDVMNALEAGAMAISSTNEMTWGL